MRDHSTDHSESYSVREYPGVIQGVVMVALGHR